MGDVIPRCYSNRNSAWILFLRVSNIAVLSFFEKPIKKITITCRTNVTPDSNIKFKNVISSGLRLKYNVSMMQTIVAGKIFPNTSVKKSFHFRPYVLDCHTSVRVMKSLKVIITTYT